MNRKSHRNYNYLYFSVITASCLFISSGSWVVWISPIIPKFLSNDTSINPLGASITVLQVSALLSLSPIGIIVGTICLGKLPDIIGRKATLIIVAAIVTIVDVALYFARYLYQFIIFLLMKAVIQALCFVTLPSYVAEIADDHNRGSLGSLLSVMLILGQLYAYGLGIVTSVKSFFLFCSLPSFVVFVVIPFIPESPIYLSIKKDEFAAAKVLKKLGRTIELRNIDENQHMLRTYNPSTTLTWKSLIFDRPTRKGFILNLGIISFFDLSGILVVIGFMPTIFKDVGGSLRPEVLAFIVMAIKLLVTILAINVIEKLGRRPMILTGFFICGCSMFVLGIFLYFKHNGYVLTQVVKLIPLITVLCFVFASSMGISPVLLVLRAELLPNELRSLGSSLSQFFGTIIAGILMFFYPLMSSYWGMYYCMFIFSFICFCAFGFLYLLLPETKGKSFSEIRKILDR
ncbi:glucose transporter GlcP-like [Diorhabda sublineata]|uniref:glucose transporter GlcP-like n=1 Tax=Diorhabda sublineata TaxID=1163346 RepID=UPI0024E16EAE|nr:glucose transporter GlcP-like [Diorhabda sublineata]